MYLRNTELKKKKICYVVRSGKVDPTTRKQKSRLMMHPVLNKWLNVLTETNSCSFIIEEIDNLLIPAN